MKETQMKEISKTVIGLEMHNKKNAQTTRMHFFAQNVTKSSFPNKNKRNYKTCLGATTKTEERRKKRSSCQKEVR